VACPNHVTAKTIRSFGVADKYAKFSRLRFAHVCHEHVYDDACAFALTHAEARESPEEMDRTRIE